MIRELRRMWAFLKGDFTRAEGLDERPASPEVPWITASAASDAKATYALEASIRAANDGDASVKSIQEKAQSLLTLILALFPLAIATTILVVPSGSARSWPRLTAFFLFAATDLFLIGAAIKSFLAAGLVLSGGFNPRHVQAPSTSAAARLKAAEADAWYAAAEIAFWSGMNKAKDLFGARRLLIAALLAAVVATPFIYLADSEIAPPEQRCQHTK